MTSSLITLLPAQTSSLSWFEMAGIENKKGNAIKTPDDIVKAIQHKTSLN